MPTHAKKLCEFTGQVPLAELRESHILTRRPFVYRGFFPSAEEPWSDEALVELIGSAKVPVFYTDAEQSAYTDGRLFVQIIPFREFVEREEAGIKSSGYMLAKDIADDLPEFYSELDIPDIVKGEQCNLWYSRRENTTTLHYDRADNFVRVLRGTKVFTIIPPHSRAHPSPFWGKGNVNFSRVRAVPDFERLGGYQVKIGPGDLFFLPRNWWHHVVSTPGAAVNFWWDEKLPTKWYELRHQRRHFLNRALRRFFDRALKRNLSAHIRSGPRSAVSQATLHANGQSADVQVLKLGVGVMYVRKEGVALPSDEVHVEMNLPETAQPISCKGLVRSPGLDDDLAEILFDEISAKDTDRLVALVSDTQRGCDPGEI